MNAYYLMRPDGTRSGYTACGRCHVAALEANIDISELCCICRYCKKELPEGVSRQNRLYHDECEVIMREESNRKALDSAELVEGYDGPVYFEGGRGSFGNGYYADAQELAESLPVEKRPAFAFCCEQWPYQGIDLDNVLENLCEEMFEEARDHLNGVEELEGAVVKFNEANQALTSWMEDRKRKVAVPQG